MRRPFASGSRQAPDPFDQFLEQEGFYRKHTARDSSSLFRTISEQLYDTQLHHLAIRETCVSYMRTHKPVFQNSINKDIDEYLDELSKPKTFGTFIELHAIAYLYRRNIIIFQAFDTGEYFIENSDFEDVFRVFSSPDNHFDSVFTVDFIEDVAFCQSLTYEILYKKVFKLPDITYAVEKMLHAYSFEYVSTKTEYDGPYIKRMILDDGRIFNFDRPENTNCILDNHLLCHFHNVHFATILENIEHSNFYNLIDDSSLKPYNDGGDTYRATKNSLLYEKYISCVRQLLNEGITPFPYKVAKALDPDIYRNIEFDSWSEMKREQRFKNCYNEGNNLQVGVKCLVKLRNSQVDLFTCHIQEMSPEKGPCLVYIEDIGEKHVVPYEFLQPLPRNETKPWTVPYRIRKSWKIKYSHKFNDPKRNMYYNNEEKIRNESGWISYYDYMNYRNSIIMQQNYDNNDDNDSCEIMKKDVMHKLKQFTSLDNFNPIPTDIIAMPFGANHNVENSGNEKNSDTNKQNSNRNNDNSKISTVSSVMKQETKTDENDELEYPSMTNTFENYSYGRNYGELYYPPYSYDNSIIHMGASHSLMTQSVPHPHYYCMFNSPGIYMQPPMHCYQPASPNFYSNSYYPPPVTNSSVSSNSIITSSAANVNVSTPLYHRNSPTSPSFVNMSGRINFQAKKSVLRSGFDLPNDISTLRYFYNLGIDYYKQTHNPTPDETNREHIDKEVNKVSEDIQTNLKFEDNTVNTQTNKSDSNNNLTSNACNNMQGPQNSRRFHSRYFNNSRKDNRGFNRNTTQVPRYISDTNKNQNVNKNQQNVRTFSSSNAMNSVNIITSTPANEQENQISPITTSTSDSDSNQATSLCNTSQNSLLQPRTSCTPTYPTEDQQPSCGTLIPPQPLFSGGIYGPPSYPGQPSSTSHNGGLQQSYGTGPPPMAVPPPPSNQSFSVPSSSYPHPPTSYFPQGPETPSQGIVGSEGLEPNYTFMTFPPIYYPVGGNTAPTAPPPPSAYWFTTPHQQAVQFPVPTNQGNPTGNNLPQPY